MNIGSGRNVVMKFLNMQLVYGLLYISSTTPELPIAHRWDCFWLNYCQTGSTDEFCVICRDVVIILTIPRVDLACSSLGFVVTLSVWMNTSIHLVVKGMWLQELMNLIVHVHSFIGGHLNIYDLLKITVLLGVESKLVPVKRFFVLSCCQVISNFIHSVLHPHEYCTLVTNTYLQTVSWIYRNSIWYCTEMKWNDIDSQFQEIRRLIGLKQMVSNRLIH